MIGDTTARLTESEGRAPEGWLGPWISQSRLTPDLLAEAGYRYLLDWCMDDQPIWFRCRGGKRIMAVPYPQELDDLPALASPPPTAATLADMIADRPHRTTPLPAARPPATGAAPPAYILGHPCPPCHLHPP